MKKLLLVRHCSVSLRYRGVFVGSTDVGLGPDAVSEADRLAGVLSDMAPEAVLCSPLQRTRETAALLGLSETDGALVLEPALREIDFGLWETKSFGQLKELYPEQVRAWADDSGRFVFPGGEAVSAFRARVAAITERILARDEGTILLVTHGGVIRTMICQLLRLPAEQYLLFDVQPAGMTVLTCHEDGAVLSGLNR